MSVQNAYFTFGAFCYQVAVPVSVKFSTCTRRINTECRVVPADISKIIAEMFTG